ncbi:MAG: protein-L-isoaspartate(D-aspartate) O-methyltransferase [Deltaproteobacteria bacterium]|nr:protein-L-isoaspartate(D-aspartate) O-methyltransferase [Deltaproteobacteria bacterium]
MPGRDRFHQGGLSARQQGLHVARRRMVREQLERRGVRDPRVLSVIGKVPRHLFVEEGLWDQAYSDRPLTIGEGQTISQPFIVGYMTAQLRLTGTERVLEIGTGCGYQTAVLCSLAREVYSIERIATLSHRARRVLYDLGLVNFSLRIGDGTVGWPEAAPFDAIIVTAGGPEIPQAFLAQLADGGRLVIPVGSTEAQTLLRVTRKGAQFTQDTLTDCRFVKLVGAYGWRS